MERVRIPEYPDSTSRSQGNDEKDGKFFDHSYVIRLSVCAAGVKVMAQGRGYMGRMGRMGQVSNPHPSFVFFVLFWLSHPASAFFPTADGHGRKPHVKF
jgi:hypothetical protein